MANKLAYFQLFPACIITAFIITGMNTSMTSRDAFAPYQTTQLTDTPKVRTGDNIIFTKVEVPPSFQGGTENWQKFLVANLVPGIPVNNGAPRGTYAVEIRFIVDKLGTLRNFSALTSHGYGMEQEALRILKASPPWVPAIQNGHKVSSYHHQKFTFVVPEDKKNQKN
jgi:periplasmic protein TonB